MVAPHPLRSYLLAALLCLLTAGGAGSLELYPPDELRGGETGEAFSVFRGDSITRFEVEVIDRVPGQAPYDLILVRCLGEELERSGVSQGMSGSPVYIDGRWLGAIAFNFSFSREPLALVTPAAAMLELARRPGLEQAQAGGGVELLPWVEDVETTPAAMVAESPALSISVGGLGPQGLEALGSDLQGSGLRLLPMGAGGAAPLTGSPGGELGPGSAVAVALMRGPISAAAIGTVTHRDGDRIWAFGHPFLGEGPISLPLAAARIHSVMPSLMNSFKLGSVGETLGTFSQDGQSGIYGKLGEAPDMLPLRVSLRVEGEPERIANFSLARHRRLTPMLARMAVDGWLPLRLAGAQRGGLALTLRLQPGAGLGEAVTLRQQFAGESSSALPGAWLQSVLAVIQGNPDGPLPLEFLSVELSWTDDTRPLVLEDLGVVRESVRVGEEWRLRLRLKAGEAPAFSWSVDMPAGAGPGVEGLAAGHRLPPGDYRLHVADGASFDRWNAKRQPALYRFRGHAGLLDLLGRLESSEDWLIWLEAEGGSSVRGGRELDLPVYFRQLNPDSRREQLGQPKKPRRLVALRRETSAAAGLPRGHLSLPVTVLAQPRRSKP
jgi:hypothetical protein